MNYSEKDIEDFVEEHIQHILEADDCYVAGRQVVLPSGRRADLIVGYGDEDSPYNATVVEIKRGRVDRSAVLQTLEYIAELTECLRVVGEDYRPIEWFFLDGILIGETITERASRLLKAVDIGFMALDIRIVIGRDRDAEKECRGNSIDLQTGRDLLREVFGERACSNGGGLSRRASGFLGNLREESVVDLERLESEARPHDTPSPR